MAGGFTSSPRFFRVFANYAVVSRALAVLLLTAAGLKLAGLGGDPVRSMGIFASTTAQLAAIEVEFFLAALLLWGRKPIAGWVAALGVFAVFAAINIYHM